MIENPNYNADKLRGRYNTETVTSAQDGTQGLYSMLNRYALFSYKGIDGDNNPLPYYDEELTFGSGNLANALNPTAAKIVEGFRESYGAMEYDWADFLYLKHYGVLPNNHMITLRRFPTPCADNIYNQDLQYQPDLARVVGYFGPGTENKLTDLVGMEFGLNWSEMESEIQVLHSQKLGFGLASTLAGRNVARDENLWGILKGSDNAWHRNDAAWKGETDIMDTYPNFVYGPVNVIDKMMRRDRGLFHNYSVEIKTTYELRSLGGINPKVAMLEALANILTVGYNNAPFFGGARRYSNDPRRSHLLGDQDLLLSGDYGGYLNSVGSDLLNAATNLFNDGQEGFGLGDVVQGFKRIAGGVTQNIFGNALNNSGVRPAYQAVHALLSGEPTGDWHITVGNPFSPIAMFGNMILEGTTLEWGETLGADDFPNELHATFKLKAARPRDKGDIESAFNAGKGRLYHSPEGMEDIINATGNEKPYVYGRINPTGGNGARNHKTNNYADAERAEEGSEASARGLAKFGKDKAVGAPGKFAKWADIAKVQNADRWVRFG